MIKKLSMLLTVLVFFAAVLLGCTNSQREESPVYKEKKISEVTGINYNEITKIVFSDGRGWNKPFTLEDNQKISEFTKLLDSYVVKKEKNHQVAAGWIHRATFYNGDKKLMQIVFVNAMNINEDYYYVVKGELSTVELDSFIKSVNPSWKTS